MMVHNAMWDSMMVLGVPAVEKIIRSVVIYGFLILGLRLAGKRELAQMNPFDLVVLLILSNAVQNAIIGNDNSVLGGLISATTLFVLNYTVVRVLYKRPKLSLLVEGRQDVLIQNGHIIQKHLEAELITHEELTIAAMKQGFNSLKEVKKAVLLPNGTLLFTGKHPQPEESRHDEVLQRLDLLSKEVLELKKQLKRNA